MYSRPHVLAIAQGICAADPLSGWPPTAPDSCLVAQRIRLSTWGIAPFLRIHLTNQRRSSTTTVRFLPRRQLGQRIKSIALTDFHNSYDAVGSAAANSPVRSMGVLLAYVRDSLISVRLSFPDAIFNLADVATKTHGDRGIYAPFAAPRQLAISL